MSDNYHKKVLILALYAGEIMMKSGAEIYRVEDTITRICKAYGIPYVESFATSTGIFLSLDNGGDGDDVYTFIKRIKSVSVNFKKISGINHFSRILSASGMSVDDGMKMLKEIDAEKPYPLWLRLLGAAITGTFFCIMFNGALVDCLTAALIVSCAYPLAIFIKKLQFHSFISVFIGCALASTLAVFAFFLNMSSSLYPVLVGSITVFLPGVAITNATRDLLSGEMLAGLSGVTEAILTSVAIAGGIGFVLSFWNILGGTVQ